MKEKMAPLKFEENIKENLDKREINPSPDTWHKIAAQLDEAEENSHKENPRFWYLIAASIIGLVIITSVIFNNVGFQEKPDQNLVEVNDNRSPKENKVESINTNETRWVENSEVDKIEAADNSNAFESKSPEAVASINPVDNKKIKEDKRFSQKVEDNTILKETSAIAQQNDDINKVNALEETNLIEAKVADIVNQVNELKRKNTTVTDEEIEQLIRKAQREITTDKILENKKVDAMALLNEVESELDETFKERVFEALKTGFQKVKTAVAERNN